MEQLRAELNALAESFMGAYGPKWEIESDVRHAVWMLLKRLKYKQDTPVVVHIDGSTLCIRVGKFEGRWN